MNDLSNLPTSCLLRRRSTITQNSLDGYEFGPGGVENMRDDLVVKSQC